MKVSSALLSSLIVLTFHPSAYAVDVAVTGKYICRVEDGKGPLLLKAGSLKTVGFSKALKELDRKITDAKAKLNRIAVTKKNKAKLAAAKAKVKAAAQEKKDVSACKSGKVIKTTPTPVSTPNETNTDKVAATVEEKFGTYAVNGFDRCAFFTFLKWPATPGAIFNKISYDFRVNNPPVDHVESDIASPYEDVYVYMGVDGNTETGISFTVEPGFHWVQFGRFDSFGDDCTNPTRRMKITDFRAGSYANVFAHRAN